MIDTPNKPFPPQLVEGAISTSLVLFVLVLYTIIFSFSSTLAFSISLNEPSSLLNLVLPMATMKSKYAFNPARLPGLFG